MKKISAASRNFRRIAAYCLAYTLVLSSFHNTVYAENAADYVALPPLINNSSSGDKANVLFILDNSNSMDEAPNGQGVGSANSGSKSEIARNAVKNIIDNFGSKTRMGLMAYQQENLSVRSLHDSQYDVSYNPDNYDPNFTGDRASSTKRYRKLNPSNSGKYIYFNIALPFYSGRNNYNRFCYSDTADFDNGSENALLGPWDYYDCYRYKLDERDTETQFYSRAFGSRFQPTDSDFAQNILDFGTHLTWQYVSPAWFTYDNPGRGYLHVEIADVDNAQEMRLKNKLATSEFSSAPASETNATPLRNAGLTPIEGSLQSARDYFSGTLPAGESAGGATPDTPPENSCSQNDYVILVTDGLPSIDAEGNVLTDTSAAISAAATEAANLLSAGIRTYVVGFGLPTGVDGSLLDEIARAGGTGATYLADDSATLISSLESIFLSFADRETSSASSAVVSTNARGEGAIFQAIYSPKKEIGTKEVEWVGNVYGIFLDEEGNFREDSNGNKTLDDYATDRVVRYYFDTDAENTRVQLFESLPEDASTEPDLSTATPVATVDLDDLKTIWDAKDNLGSIQNVLSQRSYSTSAANGRYIISSVDGTSALDFIQISDEEIANLAAVQEAAELSLREAENDLQTAEIQLEAAQASVDDSLSAQQLAQSARDHAAGERNTAQAVVSNITNSLAAANAALAAAQSQFSSASQDYLDNYDSRQENLNTSIDNFRNEVNALTDSAISSTDEFDALVQHLISEGADISDSNVNQARANLLSTEVQFDRNQRDLTNELNGYQQDANDVSTDIEPDIDALANTGSIDQDDLDGVKVSISEFISVSAPALQSATNSLSYDSLNTQRQNYIDALIATGVNTNRGPTRTAIDNYTTARATESSAVADAQAQFSNDVFPQTDSVFGAFYDVYNNYESINSAQASIASLTTALQGASENLAAAQQVLDDAETALAQADIDITAAQDQLAPVQETFDAIQSIYNSALANYNQATATVNNSGTLINYLDVSSVQKAYDVVKFVRGEEGISGFRSRAIDYDGDGVDEVWRLGDIVHSSPTFVGAPSEGYDARFRDRTYAAFRQKYKNRRQMLYVGANDGMIHAFNGGFWNASAKRFETTDLFDGGTGVTEHPLGSELWAYVPRAVLPHLQWMTDPNYAHSYYVDGNPITFDANIFPNDATHPGGWGTVLMVGMRFGGAAIDIDSDADGVDDTTVGSSYVLLDITNPELPPTLIAEISHPNLGFTTSIPAVIKKRKREITFATPEQNDWYVLFGSGPTELADASSTQNAGLFMFDLRSKAFVSGFDPLVLEENSFVGDIKVYDDGGDFVDDTAYFGVNGGSPSTGGSGILKRTRLDVSPALSTSTLINPGKTILGAPGVARDNFGERWISFGTGRLLAAGDNVTTLPQHYYGVMEPKSGADFTWTSVSDSNLVDVTNFEVIDNGEVTDAGSQIQIPSGVDIDSVDSLTNAVRKHRAGWKLALDNNGEDPSMRNLSRPDYFQDILLFTTYQPANNLCAPEGSSRLYGVDFRTGTALPYEPFAVNDNPATSEGNKVASYVSLGFGLSTAPTVISNANGASVLTNNSIGLLDSTALQPKPFKTGRQSWRQLILD